VREAMRIALLMNQESARTNLARVMGQANATVDEYSTASKALVKLTTVRYDLVAIHWKVYPGVGSGDPSIDELAALIPHTELNRNLLYWEVGLRVIDAMREEGSPTRETPVIVMFPNLGPSTFNTGDDLARESVESDLAIRQPACAVFGSSIEQFTSAVSGFLLKSS